MENIKEQLEEVINKKHNELFKIDYNMDYNTKLNLQRKILEDLADEVLKVAGEKIKNILNKRIEDIKGIYENADLEDGHITGLKDSKRLLSNLSPNKENKNNG